MVQQPQNHSHTKYDSNVEGQYFRFDDDKRMSYKNILKHLNMNWPLGHTYLNILQRR